MIFSIWQRYVRTSFFDNLWIGLDPEAGLLGDLGDAARDVDRIAREAAGDLARLRSATPN